MTNQLRSKTATAFKAIGERLVLKSNADIAFSEGTKHMLKDKQLRKKNKRKLFIWRLNGLRLNVISSNQKFIYLILMLIFLPESKQRIKL